MIAKNIPNSRQILKHPILHCGWVLFCALLISRPAIGQDETNLPAGDIGSSFQLLDLYANGAFTRENFVRGEADPSGHLWTLTESGRIRRFDGLEWYDYGLILDESVHLFDLKIMPDGSPWVASANGIFHFSGRGFEQLNLPTEIQDDAIHRILVSAEGLISIFGHSGSGGSMVAYLKGGSWDLPTLPDNFERPTFYQRKDGIEFLGSEKRLLTRENGNVWKVLISPKISRKLTFEYSHELGVIAVGATPSQILEIWKVDQTANLEMLDDSMMPTVSNEGTPVALGADADGVVILSVSSEDRQALFQIDSEGVRKKTDTLPFAGSRIRDISIDNEGGIWIAGDEILSKLSPTNPAISTAGITGKVVNIGGDGVLWSSRDDSLYAHRIGQRKPVLQVEGVVSEMGSVNGRYWFLSESGALGYLRDNHPIYTDIPGIGDSGFRPRITGSQGRTFAFSQGRWAHGIFEWSNDQFSSLNIPIPQNHQVYDVDACEDEYVWILARVPGASYSLGRWDPILEELHWQTLPIDPKDSSTSAHIYTSAASKVIVYNDAMAIEVPKNLQSLSLPVFPIQGAIEHNEGAGLLFHRLTNSGESQLVHFHNKMSRTYSAELQNWILITIDSQNTLYLRNHDGSALGRMRLGVDTSVSATYLGPLRMRDHLVFPDADTISFTAYRSNSSQPLVATYHESLKTPNAQAKVVNVIKDRDRIESKLIFRIPFSNNHPDELRSIQASYRFGDDAWSPFRPLNSQGELGIATLPSGKHAIDVRIRNRDFVEAKEFQRLSYDLSKPYQSEARAERPLLWLALIAILGAFILISRGLVKARRRNRQLVDEIQSRQQAQLDLVDINQDLEKRLKRRKQELLFANEGLKKQVDERKHTEAQLKHAQTVLVDSSRQAGIAEIATGILQNIASMLNSLNVSLEVIEKRIEADKTSQSLERLSKLIENKREDPGFFLDDPKGQKIPQYLEKMALNVDVENRQNRHFLKDMATNVDHLKDIISTQQNYAKTAGVVERIDLEETIRQALKLNEHSINRENCVVETKVDDCPPIQSERPKLQQILLNLLQNAQWACGENSETMGRVQILAYSSDTSHVVIEVKDNGVGIEAENINKVFSHGFTTRKNNNGFGLHTVETLSKQLHGTIKAHSDGPSQGASFRLTVPIDPTVQASETKAWLDSQTPPIRAPK